MNVWGTVVGIAVLAIGIAGIQQFGGAFWVEPLFNGATLLLSITPAGYAQRRRALNKNWYSGHNRQHQAPPLPNDSRVRN